MKKNDFRALAIVVIALVVFNVLSFAIPFVPSVGFWLGYGFGMLAILVQLPLLYLAFRKGDTPRSRFYGFPVAQIGGIYLLVQFVLSVLGMSLGTWIPVWAIVVVYVVVLGIAATGFIATDAMRDEIERQDELLSNGVVTMRNIQSKANAMLGLCEGKEQDVLRRLIEEIRYSDPVSNSATETLEVDLEMVLNELQKALVAGDAEETGQLCKRAMTTLAERNRLCKLNK